MDHGVVADGVAGRTIEKDIINIVIFYGVVAYKVIRRIIERDAVLVILYIVVVGYAVAVAIIEKDSIDIVWGNAVLAYAVVGRITEIYATRSHAVARIIESVVIYGVFGRINKKHTLSPNVV